MSGVLPSAADTTRTNPIMYMIEAKRVRLANSYISLVLLTSVVVVAGIACRAGLQFGKRAALAYNAYYYAEKWWPPSRRVVSWSCQPSSCVLVHGLQARAAESARNEERQRRRTAHTSHSIIHLVQLIKFLKDLFHSRPNCAGGEQPQCNRCVMSTWFVPFLYRDLSLTFL